MKKLRWLLAGFALTGSLVSVEARANDTFAQPNETLEYYGAQDPAQYKAVNYEQDGQPACDSVASCDSCGSGCDSCLDSCCDSCCVGNWCDNTEFLLGGDSYASLGDSPIGGFGNSFGLVTGFNTGFALGDSRVRGQVGGTYGLYDFSGRTGANPVQQEEQFYLTGGFYKRSDVSYGENVSWGIVYDAFFTDNWGTNALALNVGQIRGLIGYALNDCNEIGVWGTVHTKTDTETITGRGTVALRAMNQANLFWRHNYDFGGSTMLYGGIMDNADVGDWVIGFSGRAPLSHSLALYGSFNYVVPSAGAGPAGDVEDQWNVAFGLVYFFGGKAVSPNISGQQGLPLMPVANNSNFLITD